jgi:predicted Zn-dependent protease
VVHAGLIRGADSAEELAGVLAHEIAHVELRHSLNGAIKNLGLRALFALVLGDVSGTFAGDIASQLTELKFSRDAERDADREGLRRLVAGAISPHGMPRFFEKLAAKEGKTGEALALVSTHPSSSERIEILKREIAALPAREYVALNFDWEAIKKTLPSKNS